jgi:hypothetical protein
VAQGRSGLREMPKGCWAFPKLGLCRRLPYSRLEWAHGQSGPDGCAAADRQRPSRYQLHQYLSASRIEHELVNPWGKQATVGPIRIITYGRSRDIAQALQPP